MVLRSDFAKRGSVRSRCRACYVWGLLHGILLYAILVGTNENEAIRPGVLSS